MSVDDAERGTAVTAAAELSSPSDSAAGGGHARTRRRSTQTTLLVQADALFRKNAKQQLRAWKLNLCLLSCAVFFPVFLLVIQGLLNDTIAGADGKCGCLCLECCEEGNSDKCLNPADTGLFICPDGYECKERDESKCGLLYSDGFQAEYCANLEPAAWPPLMQVPKPQYRAEPWAPAVAMLYTASDLAVADALAARMFVPAELSAASQPGWAAAVAEFEAALGRGQFDGAVFSRIGLNLSSDAALEYSTYVDTAFIGNGDIYSLHARSCDDLQIQTALSTVTKLLEEGLAANTPFGFNVSLNCAEVALLRNDSTDDLNRQLYCGYGQDAGCGATTPQQYAQGWDWRDSSASRLALDMSYNDTSLPYEGRGPYNVQRVNKGLNMAVNAWLEWALGPHSAPLLALQSFPKIENKFFVDFSALLGPIFYTWLLSLLLPVIVYNLVFEKHNRLRMLMAVHGLGDVPYWSIMYCYYFVLYIAFMILLVFFGWVTSLSFFTETGLGVQVVLYLIWGNNMIAFGFLLSTLFSSPGTASKVVFIYVFAAGLLGAQLLQDFMADDLWWTYIVQLVPEWALYRALYEVSQRAFLANDLGYGSFGATFTNMPFGGFWAAMVSLAAQWPFFMVAAIYFDQVLPSSGKARKPLLFFLPARLRGICGGSGAARRRHGGSTYTAASLEKDEVAAERGRVEQLGAGGGGQSVVIRGLNKVFPRRGKGPPKVAVRDATLAIGRGECFGLLGPNGAGKTTLFSMLTGYIEPTEGTATVEGYDLRTQLRDIYQFMGVCPQHDVLWNNLTPREHLRFYGRLKNLRGKALTCAVERVLASVNLLNGGVANKVAGQFSGGMKRRLSVAISLIGEPAVVYLDEPSTGLDPASRRALWLALKENRETRASVLTTHSMEEAAVLCDRLGIFVDGQLVVLGDPKYLAQKYGGYLILTLTTSEAQQAAAAEWVCRELCSSASCTYALAGTQKFELPGGAVKLSEVFTAVDAAREKLGILDWGVASASLEEVFIRIARETGVGLEG